MTDITDQDRRDALQFARVVTRPVRGVPKIEDMLTAARVILATVDAPATLAEDLAHIAEHWEEWTTDTITEALTAATTRVEQVEHDLAEALAEVERLTAEVESMTTQKEAADAASAENAIDDIPLPMPPGDIPGTALPIHRTRKSNPKEALAGSLPDPADVPSGEPWIVEFEGHSTIGKRDTVDEDVPWALLEGRWVSDSAIALVSRLVPAPRVITNPDELEQLAATSIIRDGRGWPGGVTDQGMTMINGACLSDEEVLSHGPVTVLWEAES